MNIRFSKRSTKKKYKRSVMQMANRGKAVHNAIMTEITPGKTLDTNMVDADAEDCRVMQLETQHTKRI